jgi:hypothetical protein
VKTIQPGELTTVYYYKFFFEFNSHIDFSKVGALRAINQEYTNNTNTVVSIIALANTNPQPLIEVLPISWDVIGMFATAPGSGPFQFPLGKMIIMIMMRMMISDDGDEGEGDNDEGEVEQEYNNDEEAMIISVY